MKTTYFDNHQEWLSARIGKITGTKLKGIIVKRGNGKKQGFYELIAERLMVDDGITLDPMNRGTFLEEHALDIFAQKTGKELDKRKQLWSREEFNNKFSNL